MSKLIEIQKGYFEILKKYFGHLYDEAKKNNVSPQEIARDVMRHPVLGKLTEEDIDDTFGIEVENYWRECYSDLIEEVKKLKGFRVYYGGDISPVNNSIVNRVGLYADTIIIPDPTLRTIKTGALSQAALPHIRFYLLIKSAIKMLDYEQLSLANIPQPMVIVFPSEFFMQDEYFQRKMAKSIQSKTVEFFNENLLLNQPDFKSWEEYFKKLKNQADFEKIIKNKGVFLFNSNLPTNDFSKQIESVLEYNKESFKKEVLESLGGKGMGIIFNSIFGRIAQAEWHIAKSEIMAGFPVQDAYVSWNYLKWDMRNNKNASEKSAIPSYFLEDNFLMLGNIPTEALVKLREGGELQDLRECIGKEISREIALEKPEETIKQIEYNLQEELKKHQRKVKELDENFRKSLKINIPSIITTVSFGVLGAINPWLAIPGVFIGGSSAMEIAKEYEKKVEGKNKFKKCFWGFYAESIRNEQIYY